MYCAGNTLLGNHWQLRVSRRVRWIPQEIKLFLNLWLVRWL